MPIKTKLYPPFFIEVPVQDRKVNGHVYIYARGIEFTSVLQSGIFCFAYY